MRLRLTLAGLALGALGIFVLPASPAAAHAALVRTQPVQASVVQDAPSVVVVTFSEHVQPVQDKIKVIGPDGKRYDKGSATVNGSDLDIPMRSGAPHGTYVVVYRVISADGHPVGAGFTYSVVTASTNNANADSSGRTDPTVAFLVSSADFLSYAGLILAVGPTLVLIALWPHRLDRRRPVQLARAGLGLVALATVLQLYLEAPYTAGVGLFGISGGDLTAVLDSRFGWAHLARLGVVALSAVLLRPVLAGRGTRWHRYALMLLGLAGLVTFGISGHPGTSAAPALTVIADAAHLGSMAIWIGGLVMLFGFLLRQADAKELGAILPVWSDWATASVLTLILAGTAQALVEIGSVSALLHTRYGVLVLVKIGLLLAVLAVAAVSRQVVRRTRAAGAEGAPPAAVGRLRRTVLVEVIGAVVVIGVAAALVQTAPARNQLAATNGTTNGLFSTTLTSPLYQLQLDIEPVQTGPNDIHLYAYTPQGVPLKVLEWKVNAALPAQGIEPIDAVLTSVTDSHEIGQVTLPAAGEWTFSFTLRTTEIDEATVTTLVKVTE
jgi:copper transport protein